MAKRNCCEWCLFLHATTGDFSATRSYPETWTSSQPSVYAQNFQYTGIGNPCDDRRCGTVSIYAADGNTNWRRTLDLGHQPRGIGMVSIAETVLRIGMRSI